MLITFVVDTSGSMSQKTTNGMTLLDCSKAAIEHFIKIRSKDASMRNDRFFLITSEENPITAVKIGWKDNFNSFIQEVKNLQTKDMSNLGFSLQKSFDFLNQFRVQSSIDNYGQGRNPWFIEPAIIILLTDGSSLTNSSSIIENFTLPKTQFHLNSDPTSEPFRWDQRLFSIVLKFGGISSSKSLPLPMEPAIAPMCDVTGGRCQVATNMKTMIQQVEGLMQKLQGGVVVSFEPLLNSQQQQQQQQQQSLPPPPLSLHKMLYVRQQVGFWPIPESYYPDTSSLSLPVRSAHPVIRYSVIEADTHIPENFPFDKYELEPCSLTQYLLTNKIQCTHVFMMNSLQVSGQGEPFGCLRVNSAGNSVNLFVFPYNFPRLWNLLDDLTSTFKMMPSQKWKQEFEGYLLSIPPYYINPLRGALKRFCSLNLIPDNIDSQFINFINNTIKKIKSQSISKIESERIINSKQQQQQYSHQQQFQQFQQKQSQQYDYSSSSSSSINTTTTNSSGIGSSSGGGSNLATASKKKSFHQILDQGYSSDLLSELIQQDNEQSENSELSQELSESSSTTGGSSSNINILQRNVFDIGRGQLLNQLDKMKDHIFKKKTQKDESKHHLPISQMGNYHETIGKRETLRDIDDDKKPNTPLFGNPYRKEKSRFTMSIDEADEGGNITSDGEGKNKLTQNKRRRLSGRGYPPPTLNSTSTIPSTSSSSATTTIPSITTPTTSTIASVNSSSTQPTSTTTAPTTTIPSPTTTSVASASATITATTSPPASISPIPIKEQILSSPPLTINQSVISSPPIVNNIVIPSSHVQVFSNINNNDGDNSINTVPTNNISPLSSNISSPNNQHLLPTPLNSNVSNINTTTTTTTTSTSIANGNITQPTSPTHKNKPTTRPFRPNSPPLTTDILTNPSNQLNNSSTSITNAPLQTSIHNTPNTSPTLSSINNNRKNSIVTINIETNNIIKFVHKEIRRPTKDNHDIIIQQLSKLFSILADSNLRLKLLKDIINLAKEYKKSSLISKIIGYIDQIK
ncbi:hypothetical protein RB653_004729 [Dictyostelium firmibasis]|uniref:VWFA domain-containing protein n=1 Tax=Dictyostelium firmibasis TaxID=79012 RepID=A0AAN7U044_9MYCE